MLMKLIILVGLFSTLLLNACGNEKGQTDQANQPSSGGSGNSGRLEWTVPDGWIEEPPASAMRVAQCRLPKQGKDTEDATAVWFHFKGSGGSVQANLNRWFGQFVQPDGRPSAEVAKITKGTSNGIEHTVVDLSGTYMKSTTPMGPASEEKPNYRMLACVIETESGPWFVKLTGPDQTIAHWEKSFDDLVASFKLN